MQVLMCNILRNIVRLVVKDIEVGYVFKLGMI